MDEEEVPAEVLGFWRAYALLLDVGEPMTVREVFTIKLPGSSTAALERSWEHGKIAAEIGWGTHDAMKRCIKKARKVGLRDPGGYCATRHKGATGEWPTSHGKAGIPS